ncbi:carbohydrate-binding protein [Neobacillus drentensis]|uniref:DUF7402 domain-containing protein n=1 Tax=Neobacillus drentensis TaxID=220684 RepID=UPI0030008587
MPTNAVLNANPLIASMKFDNNLKDDANQENLEGKGNHSYVDGVLPGTKALHLESGDDNYVGTTHSLNVGNDSFTTSFWYKGDTNNNQVILSNKDFTKSSNEGWAIYTSANSVNMNLGFPTTSEKFGRDTFNASDWRYVTFVVDRDKMLGSLYIDGYKMAETSLGIGTLDTSNPLNIGSDGLGKHGGNSFDIADLNVWKGAFSSDVVQANYKSYGVNKVDMKALNDTISEANTLVADGLGKGFSQTDFDHLKKVLNTATTVATTQNVKLYTQETINYYKRELSSAIFIYEKSNKTLTPAGLNVIIDSDPEVGDDPGVIDARVKMYTKELSLFPQADVMFIPGDITGQDNDVAMKGMQKIHTQLTNEGKLKNTKWYMVRGNHDGAGSQNFIPIGSAGAWNPSTNSYENHFYNSAYRVNVKGYNFVGFDGNINSSSTVGKATNLLNQIKNEADYDPTKPIFVSSHFPISGTVWSERWSSPASNSVGKYIADNNFSQVVYMSGHTQYDPTDERSHYQGAATYLDSGASSYSSYIDDGPYGGYLEGSYISYLTTPKIVNFLEVYGSKMIIKQYNLATDEYVGTPSVKIVGEGKDAFTYSRKDTRELIAPQLDEGSIKVDYLDFNNNGVGFTLKQATDNVRVLEYNIQLINKLTGKVDKSFNSLSMPMEKPYEVYKKYKVTGLSPNTPYKIRVFADDSMYNRSSQDIDILAQNINLNSITAPADAIDVAFGAAKTADALGLPKSVSLVTDDAIRVDAKVTWDVDASNYDPNVATPQTFNVNGTVTLPTIVTNLNNVPLTTSIRVFVNKLSVSTATATATASSYANDRYLPNKVLDGIKGGEPGVGEWTGASGDQGRWIQVNWPMNQTINSITFYDRANTGDWTKGGTLTFSDGSTETVSGIPNDGSGYSVHFPTRKVTWVKFQLSGQGNMGLSEMEFSWIVPDGVPLNLMSIKAPADITGVPIGTAKTADALGLPKTVSMVTDAYSLDAKVTWNVDASNYDPTVKTGQTFTVNGTVALPKGVANPNNVPLTTSISVTVDTAAFIQAENYTSMNNVKKEDTNDIGGGQALGWIGADSWMEYSDIDIPSSGTYTLQYRVAVNKSAGSGIKFIVDGVPQKTTTLPNTGGWQNWSTVSDEVTLTAGKHTIRLQAAADGFNFNWFKILYQKQ